MKINEIIKKRRKELGLTLKQIANQLGVSESLISRYESNDVKNMRVDKIAPLAKILKTTPAYLMGWDDNPTPPKPTVDTSMLTDKSINVDTTANIATLKIEICQILFKINDINVLNQLVHHVYQLASNNGVDENNFDY